MAPHGGYFVDSCSTPTQPPVATLRKASNGHVRARVATADITRLKATGWQPPQLIVVKARDHVTDLYGLLFKPTDFDPHKHYPIIDYVYPGPQIGSVFDFDFEPSRYDNQSLAELGFIVVAINGMGTPYRSASFQRLWYGNMGDNTLPDQVAALKELGAKDPWIDLNRVGMWGHSGGGNATADAHVPLSGFLQGRLGRERQSRQPQLREPLGRDVSGPVGAVRRAARPTTTTRPTSCWHRSSRAI